MTMNNTTFEERLAARLKQMGERVPPVLTEKQKECNRACARIRYANRTTTEKENDRKHDHERYHKKHSNARYNKRYKHV